MQDQPGKWETQQPGSMSMMNDLRHLKCASLYYSLDANSPAAESSEPALQSQSPKSATVSKTDQRKLVIFSMIG
jgi:hypothetical protein